MRLILIILFFISLSVNATNYYVSTSGNDANNGTSTGTTWRTIAKVNAVATNGDSVFFNKGDSWNEKLIPQSNNIYYGSYGSGSKPIITGFQSQSGWTKVSGNIWSATATNAVSGLNMVLINGQVAHKARYPNIGYLTFTSYSGDSSITGTLTGAPNYTGYEVVVRSAPWITDVVNVQSQSGGTLHLSPHLFNTPSVGGTGYFLQNKAALVDTTGEYSFDSTSKLLTVYSAGNPTVLISNIDTLINVVKRNNISFSNISFQGANKTIFLTDSSNHISISDCIINYSGGDFLDGRTSKHTSVINDTILNILNNGVAIMSFYPKTIDCDSFKFQNNFIRNVGFIAGMGANGSNKYNAITAFSNHGIIANNRIDSVGYQPINFKGQFYSIYKNYITNFCFVKDDGGAIYSSNGAVSDSNYAINVDSGSIIRANIIKNGIGAINGTTIGFGGNNAAGVYMDEDTRYVLIDSNSISNILTAGILIHNSSYISASSNTVYTGNNGSGFLITGVNNDNNVKHNICFSSNASQPVFHIYGADYGESVDSNYYSRWPTEGSYMNFASNNYTLTQWVSYTLYDAHSYGTPANITYDPVLYYSNPSDTVVIINLGQTYLDFYGTNANSFIIQPYKSVILFKAINQIPPPPLPPGLTEIPKIRFKIKSI